jgi:hypothetical protein
MLYSKKPGLDDLIVERLTESPRTVGSLYDEIEPLEKHLTLRAVYKAINKLIKAGVLIKTRRLVRIDHEWVSDLRTRLASSPIPRLTAGERVAYTFSSITHLDAFWKTIVLGLEEYERDGQVFFYNPHNFWEYMPERKVSEDAYYAHFKSKRIHAFFTIGGETAADKEFKRAYQNEYLQIDTRDIPALGLRNHLTIMNDFIISVRIPSNFAAKIDGLYTSGVSMPDIAPIIANLFRPKTNIRFTLEKNPAKALKLRRLLARNFYFPQPVDR